MYITERDLHALVSLMHQLLWMKVKLMARESSCALHQIPSYGQLVDKDYEAYYGMHLSWREESQQTFLLQFSTDFFR